MAWKLIGVLGLLSIVQAIEIQHSPLYKGYLAPALIKAPIALKAIEIEEGPSEYEFSYSVHDPHTGDIKAQKESRKGDIVEGSYELIDPDGYRRLVQYTADKHSGFNAIVHREPTDIKIPAPEPKLIAATKILAPAPKILAAAPVLQYAHAPIETKLISAPVAKVLENGGTHVSFSAPAVSYHY